MKISPFGACALFSISLCTGAAEVQLSTTHAAAPRTTTSTMTEGNVEMKTEISFAGFQGTTADNGKGKVTITCAKSDAGSCFYDLLAVRSRTVNGSNTDVVQEQFAFSLPPRTSRTFDDVLDGSTFCQSARAPPNPATCARQKF